MHRIEMSLVDHCESKGFPLVATQNGCSNWTTRNQLLWRYEDEHNGGRLVSNGVDPWDDNISDIPVGASVYVLCLARSVLLGGLLDLSYLVRAQGEERYDDNHNPSNERSYHPQYVALAPARAMNK